MFDKANKIETAPKKASKPEAPQVSIVGLFSYSCLCTAISTLTALKETYEVQIKNSAIAHWVKEGMSKQARPVNIKGIEGSAIASLELRMRPVSSVVSDEDTKRCSKLEIPLGTHTKQIGAWVLNPEIASNKKKMDQVQKALEKLDFAEELFKWQDEIEVNVVSENTMDAIFKLKDKSVVEDMIRMLAVIAAKPTLENADDAFQHVAKLMGGPKTESKDIAPAMKAAARAVKFKGAKESVTAA
jgi:hypothetical protein